MKAIKLNPKNKNNAVKTIVDDIIFPSKIEAKRYIELKWLKKSGDVLWFIRHPMFDLPGGIVAYFDFLSVWKDKSVLVEDVKGRITPSFLRNKKMVEALNPDLEIIINKMGK